MLNVESESESAIKTFKLHKSASCKYPECFPYIMCYISVFWSHSVYLYIIFLSQKHIQAETALLITSSVMWLLVIVRSGCSVIHIYSCIPGLYKNNNRKLNKEMERNMLDEPILQRVSFTYCMIIICSKVSVKWP